MLYITVIGICVIMIFYAIIKRRSSNRSLTLHSNTLELNDYDRREHYDIEDFENSEYKQKMGDEPNNALSSSDSVYEELDDYQSNEDGYSVPKPINLTPPPLPPLLFATIPVSTFTDPVITVTSNAIATTTADNSLHPFASDDCDKKSISSTTEGGYEVMTLNQSKTTVEYENIKGTTDEVETDPQYHSIQ